MWICANSFLISSRFGTRSGYMSLDLEHCQVSICDTSQANSFIFGLLELSCFSFLFHFIVIICPEAHCLFFKPLKHFLRNVRPPEISFQACSSMFFFYIQTPAASSFNWMPGSLSVSICDTSQWDFFTFDIRRGRSPALSTPFSSMQTKILQDDGSLLAQIGASRG